MKPKTKALVYNFGAFAILFIIFRFTTYLILPLSSLWLAFISALLASIVAPKFAVVAEDGREKVLMKTIFSKESREV